MTQKSPSETRVLALVDDLLFASRIEGTQTGVADLYAFEALGQAGAGPPGVPADAHEVLNYVDALEHGLTRVETLPVSQRFVRELHEILMRGVRGDRAMPGEFRTRQNYIGTPNCAIADATYVPPPVEPGQMRRIGDEGRGSRQAETVAGSASGAGTWTPRKNTNAATAPTAANATSAANAQW